MSRLGLTAAGRLIAAGPLIAIVGLLAIALPLSAHAGPKPIEGHENWKLGMTMAEARAAEPRAEPYDCPQGNCLRYFDRRFANTTIAVTGGFGPANRLQVIVVTMAVERGDNRCNRVFAQLAAFYTAAHGVVAPISKDAWIWNSSAATLSLLNRCNDPGESGGESEAEKGVINIVFEADAIEQPSDGAPGESHALDWFD